MKHRDLKKNLKKKSIKRPLCPIIGDGDVNADISAKLSARTAKTHAGRKFLQSKESQVHEEPKNSLFLRGTRCQPEARSLLADLHILRKPFSTMLGRKQEGVDVFRDVEPLEYLNRKNHCGLFCYGATNKQRPFRFVFGRMFEENLLDMYETHIKDYIPLSEFARKTQTLVASKPLVIAQGAEFESSELMKNFRNYLLDFFCVGKSNKMLLKGIDQVITLTAVPCPTSNENIHPSEILFRRYRISQIRTPGVKVPDVSLEEVGPSFSMTLERHQLPDRETWKTAIKLPKELKVTKIKNVSTNTLGETLGRVHVGVQDFKKLYTPHYHKKTIAKNMNSMHVPATLEGNNNDNSLEDSLMQQKSIEVN